METATVIHKFVFSSSFSIEKKKTVRIKQIKVLHDDCVLLVLGSGNNHFLCFGIKTPILIVGEEKCDLTSVGVE